ncbi:hypothetical protein GP486_003577 [Trichoglossum hirsutum]|uniref:Uncharacterized protein n=1 Tax=Trichoglossum hirsutum TaxID=265104 RepID=A0A9P8RQI0_9PEZI|nr:hypothetical protein GP486_003577 [Trichoglossum hirsutum]
MVDKRRLAHDRSKTQGSRNCSFDAALPNKQRKAKGTPVIRSNASKINITSRLPSPVRDGSTTPLIVQNPPSEVAIIPICRLDVDRVGKEALLDSAKHQRLSSGVELELGLLLVEDTLVVVGVVVPFVALLVGVTNPEEGPTVPLEEVVGALTLLVGTEEVIDVEDGPLHPGYDHMVPSQSDSNGHASAEELEEELEEDDLDEEEPEEDDLEERELEEGGLEEVGGADVVDGP